MHDGLLEVQFDGLVGPSHNYAGLSPGNLASDRHRGVVSRPRAAALQGLQKMRLVHGLGVPQAVLPPHERPLLSVLHRWGFRGDDAQILADAWGHDGHLVRVASSASAMWTANAATVAPSCDAADGRVHLVVANLLTMPHRALEPEATLRILRAIFRDPAHFVVHDPLPGGYLMTDEGAANHTRLFGSGGAVHLFAWGRRGSTADVDGPRTHVARQTELASRAVARLLRVDAARALFPRQHPAGIDAGGFHTDVLAVGTGSVLLLHEQAFVAHEALVAELGKLVGPEFSAILARESELPASEAVECYPFNSQLLQLPDGSMTLIAPAESRESGACRRYFERVTGSGGPVRSVHYVDLRQSMQNGGGPACLRLRVPLTATERASLNARVLVDAPLLDRLETWVSRHYRERIKPEDLRDPALHRESMAALDELTGILNLGSVYEFQRTGG
jgi:succinylarginine dihydrolase